MVDESLLVGVMFEFWVLWALCLVPTKGFLSEPLQEISVPGILVKPCLSCLGKMSTGILINYYTAAIIAYVWSGHLPSFRSGIGTPGGFMYQKGAFINERLCTQHVILLDGTVVFVHHFMAGTGIPRGIFKTCHCRSPSRSVAKLGIF